MISVKRHNKVVIKLTKATINAVRIMQRHGLYPLSYFRTINFNFAARWSDKFAVATNDNLPLLLLLPQSKNSFKILHIAS